MLRRGHAHKPKTTRTILFVANCAVEQHRVVNGVVRRVRLSVSSAGGHTDHSVGEVGFAGVLLWRIREREHGIRRTRDLEGEAAGREGENLEKRKSSRDEIP